MQIRFNVTGVERKALVAAVSEITGWDAVYQKAPTFAYVVQNYTIDKDGTLLWDERTDMEAARLLLVTLAEQGFVSGDSIPMELAEAIAAEDEPNCLAIDIPLENFTELALSNLEKLVASKAKLIRKSLGTEELPIRQKEDRLCLPWFKPDASVDQVRAYTLLVEALCHVAKTQTRIVATEKIVPNEKYAMRCFLLRLGFIGPEFSYARKILLANLSGDSSFKNGRHEKSATEPQKNGECGASYSHVSGSLPDTTTAGNTGTGGTGRLPDQHSLAEALADADLIHAVHMSFENSAGGASDE